MAKHRTGYLFKRGKTFYVSWKIAGKPFTKALHDADGNPITERREAEEAQQKLMAPFTVADEATALESIAAKLEGRKAELARIQDEQNPALEIAHAWPAFLATPNRPDSGEETLYQYECQYSAFAGWMKANHPEATALRDVTKEIAEQYAASLNGGRFSPNTYNKHLNLLTLVFRVLRHKARFTVNHWEEIQRKRLVTHSRRELTVDELRKACQSATGELRTLIAAGIYSGLRLGDCATLRWGEVDLARTIIRRIPNKSARRNSKPVLIPIHPDLLKMLSAIPAEGRGEYVLPEIAAQYLRRSDLVTDAVQGHFRSCGITLHQPGTGAKGKRAVLEVGFHSLRHSFVSICRSSNVPLSVVESLVGHSNPSMTRHYTHTGEIAAGLAVAGLPSFMGDKKAKPATPAPNLAEVLTAARQLVAEMTVQDWQAKQAALLALLATAGEPGPRPALPAI